MAGQRSQTRCRMQIPLDTQGVPGWAEPPEISGIDLCGNGVVVVPGMFAVFRSGEKNRFSSSALIKNIYRRNSSMVGRVFLVRSKYDTVQDIWAEINRRNLLVNRWGARPMALSTVSKALKTLEGDLVVERQGVIHLLQPDKLLEKLDNYVPPKSGERVRLKLAEGDEPIRETLQRQSQGLRLPLVATGTSSVGQYAVMPRGDLLSVYCPRLDVLLERLPGSQSDRFPNLELIETEEETVYFDARQQGGFSWASPVQAYGARAALTMAHDLQMALLDLLHEVQGIDVRLIVGGGFGIYLKTDHVRRLGVPTLLREWPEPRSTNDLDLFLRPELLIQSAKLRPLAEAIARLGYRVAPGAENYQFMKPGPGGSEAGSIKIDILTGSQVHFHGTGVRTDARRVRPNPSVGLHAHPVDEVPTLEEGLVQRMLHGKLSSGEPWQAEVFLPQPYTFLMMKLFAFNDRRNDADKEFGRYHALDMYTILATTTETEWRYALELRDQQADEPHVMEAGRVVRQYFSALDRLGMIRLRESPYCRRELQLDEFMSALQELFPARSNTSLKGM
ncbi:MAG: hypothetical protein NTU41_07965 [Chloroflexi bacterium]|nr:hypothetical protein [Chloroflexota bacterium]